MTLRQRRPAAAWVVPAVAVALTVGVLGPVLFVRGFVLVYDMVFVPRQPLLPSSLGLGTALPRSVPADAVIALASTVLPGDVLQKLFLAGSLGAAALGVARLVPTTSVATKVIAAIGYTWNAYVAERLFIGHWPVLLGYAMLPWVVLAGLRVRRGEPQGWPRLVLAMAPAMLGPSSGLLAAGAAVAAVGRRRAPAALGLGLLLNAPWWAPAVLRAGSAVSDPAAVGAFAARGESWGGPVLSVLGLGGIWNADVVPASRDSPVVPVISIVLVVLTLLGSLVLARRWGPRPARALVLLAALGVLVAVAGSVPPLDAGLRWAMANVPGTGLVRDGQRWAAWWALLVAVGVALAVEDIAGRLRDRFARVAVLAAAALLPLAVLPDLAWGGLGRLEPVRYPADWAAVADIVAAEPGDVLVLPFMAYRAFGWNDHRIQADPATRFLAAPTVAEDSLPVGDDGGTVVVAGEDDRVVRMRQALADGKPLDELGVAWVVVEHGTPGELPPQLATATARYHGEWVSLYRTAAPGGTSWPQTPASRTVPVLLLDAAALLAVIGALLWLLLPMSRVRADWWPGKVAR